MTAAQPTPAARSLLAAYANREPIAPLTGTHPELTVQDAYAIQLEQVCTWIGQGRRVLGHKVGLTSAVMQRQLGVDQPDYGHLTEDMFYLESSPIDTGRFISPRIEPEIAFVLGRPLSGPGVTAAEAISAVAYVLPALEIIDSRIRDWRITLADTVADNASSGAVILGSNPVTLTELTAMGLSLKTIGCVLYQRGRVVGTGAGAAVLGSPLNALVWLANTLGAWGTTLDAGAVILPGSLTAAVSVSNGDAFTAKFTGLGSVTAHFTSTEER